MIAELHIYDIYNREVNIDSDVIITLQEGSILKNCHITNIGVCGMTIEHERMANKVQIKIEDIREIELHK